MSYLGWMTYVILAIMVVSILEWFSVALNMVIFDYIAIGLFGLVIVFLLFIAFNGVLIDIKESKKHKAAIKKKDKN